ncbi:MAG TPA: MFS transporter [Acidimicrobiales bacterium]
MSSPPPSGSSSPAPAGRDPKRPWAPSPFMRLARAQAASVAGDALFAIGLAGSVFFSLDFNQARLRVALYLVLTIAPFAVAAPLVGPAIDRIKGGRKWILVGSLAARAVLCVLVVRHMDSLLFYPEAFGMLVLQKVYTISKSAIVPGTVRSDEELVEANSKLTVLSAVAVVVAAVPGGLLLKIGGGGWSVALGAVVFAVGTVLAFQLPPTTVAAEPPGEAEKQELRSAGIVLASSAMGIIRAIVGFLAFMLAFAIKENGALWELGLVAAFAQVGFFLGAVAAPRVRRLAAEEQILVVCLVTTAVVGALTAVIGGLVGAAILSLTVGATASAAKQAFDAIVQRDAPDANRGRSFARFETRFQMGWVIGALIPIIIPISASMGFAMIALASTFGVISYQLGLRHIRQGRIPVKRRRISLRRRRAVQGFDPGPPGAPPTPASTTTTVASPLAPPPPPVRPTRPGPTDPTVVADRTDVVSATAPTVETPAPAPASAGADPARRWMRPPPNPPAAPTAVPSGPPPTAVPGQLPLPLSGDLQGEPTVPEAEAPAAADTVADEPSHRRAGLLFEPDDWDDATNPPGPDTPPP